MMRIMTRTVSWCERMERRYFLFGDRRWAWFLTVLVVAGLVSAAPRPAGSEPQPVRLAFAGDCAFTDDVNKAIEEQGYEPFGGTASVFRDVDIAMVNLESVLAPPQTPSRRHRPGAPILRGSPAVAPALARAGIDLVSVANNHAFDRGADGLRASLAALRDAGVRAVGAGMSPEQALQPVIVTVRGVRVGFLAFTETLNHSPDQGASAAMILRDEPTKRIRELRRTVDVVVVAMHWGDQHTIEIAERQVWWAHQAVEAGADIVVGHHPHILQGVDIHQGGAILYSLGNFLWGRHRGKPAHSAIARVDVRKQTPRVASFHLLPVLREAPFGLPHVETGRGARFIRGGFISQSFRFGTRMTERDGVLDVRLPRPAARGERALRDLQRMAAPVGAQPEEGVGKSPNPWSLLGRYGVRVLRMDADAVMAYIDQVVEFIGGVATGKILPAVEDGSAPFPRFRRFRGKSQRDGGFR